MYDVDSHTLQFYSYACWSRHPFSVVSSIISRRPTMYIPDSHKPHPPPPPPPPHQQPPRPQSIDFQSHVHHPHAPLEDPDDDDTDREMMLDVVTATTTTTNTNPILPQPNSHPYPHQQIVLNDLSSGGEEHDPNSTTRSGGNGTPPSLSVPKKRAETWVQDETRNLISLRREMDLLFNTSKSNKHLWEEISAKMKERGFDRSPTMCTDKWRNLLKEFKKVKQQNGGNGSPKMLYYKDIEEILKERNKNCITTAVALSSAPPMFKCGTSGVQTPSAAASKVDSFMQFSDKGIEDAGISFGPIDGDETHSYIGRVISIKWGDYTRRIGIDGTPEAIKEAIKSAFGIRTKRAFWLEDEDDVVRCFDRDMPLGNYTLHLDEGVAIKVCHYDESEQMAVHTEDKTFYTEDDFREFLNRRGWSSVREYNSYRNIDDLDDLRPDGIYRGVT